MPLGLEPETTDLQANALTTEPWTRWHLFFLFYPSNLFVFSFPRSVVKPGSNVRS